MDGFIPCNECEKGLSDCIGCAWESYFTKSNCLEYECKYHYEDGCIFGFDERCKMSTCYEDECDEY